MLCKSSKCCVLALVHNRKLKQKYHQKLRNVLSRQKHLKHEPVILCLTVAKWELKVKRKTLYWQKYLCFISCIKMLFKFYWTKKVEKTVHYFNSITHPRSCCSGHREPKVLLFQKAEQQPEGLSGTRAEGNNTEHIDRPVSREPECKWSFLVFWQELLEQVARVWHSPLMGWIPIPQLLKDQALYPGLWTSLLLFNSWLSEFSYTQHF